MDKWLRNSNVVKLLALVLGILLWVVVNLEESANPGVSPISERESKIYNVSITPKYDPTQYYIKSIEPSEVMISLRGRESALRKVTTGSYKIELDLTSVGTGQFNLPLKPVGFPSGVNVEIFPPSVKVVIEELQKKEMPVAVRLTGTPANGLKAGQPIANPSRVLVTLPSSRLDQVETVQAEVNIDQAKETVVKQAKLVAYDKDGNEVEALITPAVVDIEVPITDPFKEMPLKLKILNEPANGYSVAQLIQKQVQVTVYGKQEVLNKMDFYEGPPIDLSGLTGSRSFLLDIPLKDQITRVDPDQVEVQVEIVPSATKVLNQVPIVLVGQNEEYDTRIVSEDQEYIRLTLEGAPNLLDDVSVQDLRAFVDVSNLPPGRHVLKINVSLPSFIKIANSGELQTTVEITDRRAAPAGP